MKTLENSNIRKDLSIEMLRILCALTVVIDHVAITAIHLYESTSTDFDKFIYYSIQHWSHFAVPIFLMISGYLLLNPQKEIGYRKAIMKYAKRMCVVLITVGLLFALLESFFNTHSISFQIFCHAFRCVLEDKGWGHMWYLYMMIGIYLLLPVIKGLYLNLSKNTIKYFLFLMFLFTSFFPIITSLTNFEIGVKFPLTSIFLFYFLIGRWAFNYEFWMGKYFLTFITLVLMIIPVVLSFLEYYNGLHSLEILIAYHSPLMVVISILTILSFRVILGGVKLKSCYLIEHLGSNSFGIYVFHMFWINLIYKFFHYNPITHNGLMLVVLMLLVFVLADITTILFRKIPYLGNYI